MATSPGQGVITELLAAVDRGDDAARDRLWRTVYDELHAMARQQMVQEGGANTLQATVLVNEAYVRLVGRDGDGRWQNRRHFFSAAATAMRRIRVDEARRRRASKRGGGRAPGQLASDVAAKGIDADELVALDDALQHLEAIEPRRAEIVSLRYFVGLTVDETAELLGLSPRTVDAEWRFTRAWLHRELTG